MKRNLPQLVRALAGILVPTLVVVGCGSGQTGPPIYPVSGKVLVDGKPAEKARVTFHPAAASAVAMIPYAETEADGTFSPSTQMTRDGAPAGDYLVTIVWPELAIDHGEEISGRDRLGGHYSDPRRSNLRVNISDGHNRLQQFELKSSGRANKRNR